MKPIVLVEDESQVRSFLKKLLSREGFEVFAAHDGPSAISLIRENSGNVAALVTDIEMVGMSGIALAKTVAEEFPQVPVVFVTAVLVSEEDLRRDVPQYVMLQKPFYPKQLVQSLRTLLVAEPIPPTL